MIPDRSIRISADRGGTFCDVFASYPDPDDPTKTTETVVKLLSQDPANYRDAPTEGIRRILEIATGESIPSGSVLPTDKIDYIRLSTTVATNALLERKGHKHALLITKGFKDLLLIGNQSRPKIFDLNIRRPAPLYSTVVEVDERVTLVGFTSDPLFEEHAIQFGDSGDSDKPSIKRGYRGKGWDGVGDAEGPGEIVRGLSGEAVRLIKKPDMDAVRADLERLYNEGYRSLAVVLVHSYTFPDHERLIGDLARSIGFTHVSESAALLPMIKMVPRGVSSTADAYLTPILKDYLDGFFQGFDEKLQDASVASPRVEFMSSDGGLVDLKNFSGLKSILSGPAGGVVGYALTSWDKEDRRPVIGLDVGGTSTDVSRFNGRYELVYETTTAGVTIQSPQMDINTVAAGGGSRLFFRNGLFQAGPESAGAEPGPVCYRKGGPLAITDANLFLGRLLPEYFPKIFGKSAKEPLDVDATRRAFKELAKEINASIDGEKKTLDEIVYGYIKVANETMCRPIRALTEARGHATSKHILASFGGAGGQHACEIARLLGITTIIIHRYSSILSAYGLHLADRAFELQEPSSAFYTPTNIPSLRSRLDKLESNVRAELKRQGFEGSRVHVERMLNMRFDGTDTALMVVPALGPQNEEDFESAFKKEYKTQFGFLLDTKNIIVDDIKVRGTGKTFDTLGPSIYAELAELRASSQIRSASHRDPDSVCSVYFDKIGRVERTPVYVLNTLPVGTEVSGPSVVIDDTQTVLVTPEARAVVTTRGLCIVLGCLQG
ncbi:Hydantoinase/oxoprolinase-domain-containing protein [Amanita rubescens]|nr:Hydantoinase/oxoprolinase-domain-containing protein [Amanita rubescens]